MSEIEEAIQRLQKIADRPICSSRREELLEIISLLKKELQKPDSMEEAEVN